MKTRGVILTGIIGIALMSWELLKSLGWIETEVSVEGPLYELAAGLIQACSGRSPALWLSTIFLSGTSHFDLIALYKDNAGYPAWNMAGLIAFLVPVGLTIAAIMIGTGSWFHGFYTYGWFTGSILGGLIYYFVANNETRSSK